MLRVPQHSATGVLVGDQSAGSLVEVLISVLIFAIGYMSISRTCAVSLATIRSQRETIAATQLLQERLESMQAAGWAQVTTGSLLTQTVLAADSPHGAYLNDLTEIIEVTTYPPVIPAPTSLKARRRAGVVTLVSEPPVGISLRQILAVQVKVRAEWKSGDHQRARARELNSVIALGGLLR